MQIDLGGYTEKIDMQVVKQLRIDAETADIWFASYQSPVVAPDKVARRLEQRAYLSARRLDRRRIRRVYIIAFAASYAVVAEAQLLLDMAASRAKETETVLSWEDADPEKNTKLN